MATPKKCFRSDGTPFWEVRYRDERGKSREKRFARQVEARAFATEVEHKRSSGTFIDRATGRVPFVPYATAVLDSRRVAASTRASDRSRFNKRLVPFFRDVMLVDIDPTMLRRFVSELHDEDLAYATIRDCSSLVRIVIDRAAEDRLIAPVQRPKRLLKGIGRPESADVGRWLQVDELLRIEDMLPEFYRPVFLLLAHSGLRLSEAMGLKRDDFDVHGRKVTVRRALTDVEGHLVVGPPKTKTSARTIELPSFVVTAVVQHLLVRRHDNGEYLFRGVKGGHLRQRTLRRVWDAAVARSGVGPARLHDLRHSHASELVNAGWNFKRVQMRLGHSSISVTMNRYAHVRTSDDARDLAALELAWHSAR